MRRVKKRRRGVHGHFTDKGCAAYSGTICRGLCIDQAADRADQWEYRDIDRENAHAWMEVYVDGIGWRAVFSVFRAAFVWGGKTMMEMAME